jgi:hypothetical protein
MFAEQSHRASQGIIAPESGPQSSCGTAEDEGVRGLRGALATIVELGMRASTQNVHRADLIAALESLQELLGRYHANLERGTKRRAARPNPYCDVLHRYIEWSADRQQATIGQLVRAARGGAEMSEVLLASSAMALALNVEIDHLARDAHTIGED